MKPKLVSFIPAVFWFILIYILLVMPNDDLPSSPFLTMIYFDKWVHAGLFGTQTLLISLPFFKSAKAGIFLFVKAMTFSICYGIAMEYVQKYFTGGDRDYDVLDILADSVGAILGCLFTNFLYKKYLLKQQRLHKK